MDHSRDQFLGPIAIQFNGNALVHKRNKATAVEAIGSFQTIPKAVVQLKLLIPFLQLQMLIRECSEDRIALHW